MTTDPTTGTREAEATARMRTALLTIIHTLGRDPEDQDLFRAIGSTMGLRDSKQLDSVSKLVGHLKIDRCDATDTLGGNFLVGEFRTESQLAAYLQTCAKGNGKASPEHQFNPIEVRQ